MEPAGQPAGERHEPLEHSWSDAQFSLRQLLDTLPVAAYTCDVEGRLTGFNARAVQLWGRVPRLYDDAERFSGSQRMYWPDGSVVPSDQCWMALALRDRRPYVDHELDIEHVDGRRIRVRVHARPLDDAAGRPLGAINVLVEVPQWNLDDAVLMRQKETLERIATGQPLADVLTEIVRLVEEQLPASVCSILRLEGDRLRLGAAPRLPAEYNALVDGLRIGPSAGACGTAAFFGRPVITADILTDPRWEAWRDMALRHGLRSCWSVPILSSRTPSRPEGARGVLGTFAVYQHVPVTPNEHDLQVVQGAAHLAGIALERVRSEQALRESEERLELVLENLTEGLIIADCDGHFLHWNRAAFLLHGFSRVDSEHQSLARYRDLFELELLDGTPLPFEAWPLSRILRGEVLYDLEVRIRRRDCDWERIFSYSGGTVMDSRERRLAFMTINDVTSRKREEHARQALEEQLRHAHKMQAIGQLAGGIAHDFNNLLTVINVSCELLALDLPQAPRRVHESIAAIQDAGQHAALLTRQLLTFSRKAVWAPKILDLNDTVRRAADLLARLIGEDITLSLTLPEDVHPVRADPGQLDQVLMNLALNARDAMPLGGSLWIETSNQTADEAVCQMHPGAVPGPYVKLSVRDTGCGMSPEVQARAFEPYFTTKGPGQGTGLGLATVYGIVQQCGGWVDVQSLVDRGTTFDIYLPAAGVEPLGNGGALIESAVPRGSETVLVVEDHPTVRQRIQRILERNGYTVLTAEGGPAALRLVEQYPRPIDLLITDVVLPEMSGRQLAAALLGRGACLKTLYLSGYHNDAVVQHGVQMGAANYLCKPFTGELLARKVREVLDEPE